MATSPAMQTYQYIQDHWRSQTLDGKRAMCHQLEQLTVHEQNAFVTAILQNRIRELDESIRLDIDQEIVWGYGRH